MAISVGINGAVVKKIQGKLENAHKFFDKEDAKELGEAVVLEMKTMIAKGMSPIRGVGRFPGYKHQGKDGRYPKSVMSKYPNKKQRPVNLHLTGAMLSSLVSKVVKGQVGPAVQIGYQGTFFGFRKSSAQKKEQGHREGVNGQPKRPTIPEGEEQFAAKIQSLILSMYRKAYKDFVNK